MTNTTTTERPVGTLLSKAALNSALLERFHGGKTFEDRETYVGASEVGTCLRLVAWRKLHPAESQITDPKSAGRMRAGTILENEFVQMVRLALGGKVRETGGAQAEIVVPDAPMRLHPDGRILASAIADLAGHEIHVLGVDGKPMVLDALPEGDGALEIKTAASYQMRRFLREGLSLAYKDQTQCQTGSQGLKWGLLVLGSRENLEDVAVFFWHADPDAYEAAKERARRTMAAVEKIQAGILEEQAGLPEPDTERGYCQYCPIADTCPALVAAKAVGDAAPIPPDLLPDVEALAETYLELKPQADEFEEAKNTLRDLLINAGVTKGDVLPDGTKISMTLNKGKTTADAKALARKYPTAAADPEVVKTGDPYFVMKITPTKA
jgi:hypothetical protein